MATTFALTAAPGFIAGVPASITLTLDATHGSTVVFALSANAPGTFSNAAPTITVGQIATTVTFTTTALEGTVTITAGSVTLGVGQTISVPIHYTAKRTTANQLISQALSHLGVRAAGSGVDGQESTDALNTLNLLVDSYRVQNLFAYAIHSVTTTLPASTGSLTIGPSGQIPLPYRPVRLEEGSYVRSGTFDYPLRVMTDKDYQQLNYKSLGSASPSAVFYEPTLPNGTIWFYPQSGSSLPVTLQVAVEVGEFADLTTGYVLSPGYARMLGLALAEELAPAYERMLSPIVARNLALARKQIRLSNYSTPMTNQRGIAGNIYVGWESGGGGYGGPVRNGNIDGGGLEQDGGSGNVFDGGEV